MRSTALMVTSALLTGLSLAPGWGQEPTVDGKQVLRARYAAVAPVIDGQLTAGEWDRAAVVSVDFDTPTIEPGVIPPDYLPAPESEADLSFEIRALYDSSNLYVAVAVTDDIVIHDSPPTSNVYDDDAVQLQFDGDRQQDPESQYGPGIEWNQVSSDTNGDDYCFACDLFGQTFDWESAPGLRAGGYIIEFRISLSSIDVVDGSDTAPPAPDAYIGFNVVVEDDDNGGQGANLDTPAGQPVPDPSDNHGRWTSTASWLDTQTWGLLYFEPEPGPEPPTAVGAASWGMLKQSR